jgi:hypothetical protein
MGIVEGRPSIGPRWNPIGVSGIAHVVSFFKLLHDVSSALSDSKEDSAAGTLKHAADEVRSMETKGGETLTCKLLEPEINNKNVEIVSK